MQKQRTNPLVLFFIMVVFAMVSSTSFADDKKGSSDTKFDPAKKYDQIKERKMKRMIEELNLTEDQQKKIKAIQDGQKDAFVAKKKVVREKRKALKKAMQEDTTDAELRKLNDAAENARLEFSKLRFELVLAIRAVLTPEQKKKFKGFGRHKKGGHGKGPKGSKAK